MQRAKAATSAIRKVEKVATTQGDRLGHPLTRAEKGLAAQGAVGVARDGGSSRQLVASDTFLSLSSILIFVLQLDGAFPLWGQRRDLGCLCIQAYLEPQGSRARATLTSRGRQRGPVSYPLTLSLCLVTRLRRELSLYFALVVPLSLLSILLAPSSLLRGGKMDEGGQQGQRPF